MDVHFEIICDEEGLLKGLAPNWTDVHGPILVCRAKGDLMVGLSDDDVRMVKGVLSRGRHIPLGQ